MAHQIFEVDVSEGGYIHFQVPIPEWRGKKAKLVLFSADDTDLHIQDFQKSADTDWSDWLDPREDIYEEYGKHL